jgi:hypothetical protein
MNSSDSEQREAAAKSRECIYCHGEGMLTIFHHEYKGQPQIEVTNRDGEVRKITARIAAHCVCPLGEWTRSKCPADIVKRIPSLHAVLTGQINWTIHDPTLPNVPDEVPDWKAFREDLAAMPGPRAERIGTGVDRQGKPVFDAPKEFNARQELGGRYEREGDYES